MSQLKEDFEDFEVGTRTITEEEIIAFAKQYDPQPFHVNHEAAARSVYGGIIASGWQTCAMMMRMMVDGFLRDSSSLGSPGVDEVRWLKPVRAGDTLTVSSTVLDARPSASKADRGVVSSVWHAKNQRGELVVTVKGMGMFGRRPATLR